MKVYVYKDSSYPVYGIGVAREGSINANVPEELVERYHKAEIEYDVIQTELEQYSCE